MGRKIFQAIGIFSVLSYGATIAGYYLNDKTLTLPFEIVYFFAIVGTLVFLGHQVYLQSKKKEFREGTHLVASASIFLGILILLYMIGARHHQLIDITKEKKFSLSDQTVKVLASLQQPVEILGFFKKGQEGSEPLERLFQQYAHHSEKMSYQIIDPQEKPTLVEKYNIEQIGEIILQSGEKIEKVVRPSEEEITNTILKVTSERTKKIIFASGHDEPSLDDGEKNGYSLLKKHLELQNYEVREAYLFREEQVLENADCLVIASPKKELFENEIQLIKNFIGAGGSVLFLLDPKIVPTLNQLVEELGFDTKEAMIVDPLSRVFGGNAFTPVATQYIPHEITNGFRIACFFPTVRMVDVKTALPGNFTGLGIAYTAPGSWAEFDFASLETKPELNKEIDIQGPVSIMAVLEDNWDEEADASDRKRARIVAFGDSNFIDNSSIGLSGNKDLFLNAVSWLTRDENLISIRKTQSDSVPLFLKKPQQILVFTVPVIGMPLTVLGIGIFSILRLRKE